MYITKLEHVPCSGRGDWVERLGFRWRRGCEGVGLKWSEIAISEGRSFVAEPTRLNGPPTA